MAGAAAVALSSLLRLAGGLLGGDAGDGPGRRHRVLADGGIVLLALGILISNLTHAEGRFVVTEEQQLSAPEVAASPGAILSGRSASLPRFAVAAGAIHPRLADAGRKLLGVAAELTIAPEPGGALRTVSPGLILPAYLDGTWFRISGFGYAPYYRIASPSGEVYDEAFVMMRLFPPGAEDSFRIVAMPNTFYVRYFPRGTPEAGDRPEGRVQLRVARNLDLLLPSRLLALGEPAQAGGVVVSVEQVRKWVEVSYVSDKGLPLIAGGAVTVVIAIALAARAKRGAAAVFLRDREAA